MSSQVPRSAGAAEPAGLLAAGTAGGTDFLLAKPLNRFDRRLVLLLATGLAVVSWVLPIEAVNRASVLQHFVYFVFGAYFPGAVAWLARQRRPGLVPVLLVTYPLLGGLLLSAGAPRGTNILVLSVVAVPLGIRLAVALARHRLVARVGSFLGRRTLPIYVLHVPILSLWHHLVPAPVHGAGTMVLVVVYPLLTASVLVAGSLCIYWVSRRLGMPWLFGRPSWAEPASAAQPGGRVSR